MPAGEYRHPIQIQHKTISGKDSEGITFESWTKFVDTRAAKEGLPRDGREFMETAAFNAEITTRFRIPYYEGITPEMRVVCAGVEYPIVNVYDPRGRFRELHLICKEVVPGG